MSEPFAREREAAIAAVRQASQLCRAVRAELDPGVLEKKDLSPVTVADFGSQAVVCRALAEAFPEDSIVAEEDAAELRHEGHEAVLDTVARHVRALCPEADPESVCRWIDHGGSQADASRFWTLDPIDGTKGFLRNEQYAVALALIVNGQVELAALACPNLPVEPGGAWPVGALFTAVRGGGATVQPLDGDDPPRPIRVSPEVDPSASRFCESVESGHSAHGDAAAIAAKLGIHAEPVRLDSQAKYGVVGRGEAQIYLRLPTRADYREKIWDHAAGMLVVSEAGGTVTDVDGRPLEFQRGRTLAANRGVIVTNGPLHGRVLEAIRQLGI